MRINNRKNIQGIDNAIDNASNNTSDNTNDNTNDNTSDNTNDNTSDNNSIIHSLIRTAFFDSLPVMAGYIVLGTGFGVLCADHNIKMIFGMLMSLIIFAGSMQYVAIDLISGGATLIASALMTLFVNIRHLFYGVGLLEKYKDNKAFKPYTMFALSDETFSIAVRKEFNEDEYPLRRYYYFFLSLMDQSYWVLGTLLGYIVYSAIEFNSAGIEFSMTAIFVVSFVEQWEKASSHIPALIGIIVSIVSVLFFRPTNFLIPTMITMTALLFICRRWIER